MHETGLSVEVYIDVVIAVNFIMDYFILWVAGRLGNQSINKLRLILAALIGACYTLVIFLPEQSFYTTLFAKALCSVVMLFLAYAPVNIAVFLRLLCYMYMTTFLMGGAIIGTIYLLSSAQDVQVWNGAAILPVTFNYYWLLVGIALALFLGKGGLSWLRKKWLEHDFSRTLVVGIEGREIALEAFIDTGNQLKDPLTKKPVIVMEAQALKGFIPEKFLKVAINKNENELASLGDTLEKEWVKRLRLINFTSVGTKQGLLVGLRVDYAEIRSKSEIIRAKDTVVGIVDGILTKRGKYKALLPPQILQENVYKEETHAASRENC